MASERDTPTSVSVVVLSHNRPHLLRQCLESITAQTWRPSEVVVIDNRSPRSTDVAAIVRARPGVQLVANANNRGYTGGMNQGLATVSADLVLFTEDDILMDATALEALVQHLDTHPDVGIASGVMWNIASKTVRAAGGEVALGARYEKRIHAQGATDYPSDAPVTAVTYVPGAVFLARTAQLRSLGGFRDDFFMYHEDDELGLRLRRAGASLHILPHVIVRHFDPDPAPAPLWLERIKQRNLFSLYLLHAPVSVLPAFFVRYGVWHPLRTFARSPRGAWITVTALASTAVRAPRLLRDRWSMDRRLHVRRPA